MLKHVPDRHVSEYILKNVPEHMLRHVPDTHVLRRIPDKHVLKRMAHAVPMN